MMKSWLRSQWRAFQGSYDPEQNTVGSAPVMTSAAAGALATTLIVVGYVPPLAEASEFRRPWISIILVAIAATLTYVAFRYKCLGPVGTAATYLDNGFYSAALTYAAMNTTGGYAMGLAVAHGLMVLAFPATRYALTLPFAVVMGLPVLVGVIAFRPSTSITLIFVASYIMCLLVAHLTAKRRVLMRNHRRLTQAFGAATRVADESVQAALGTTLLSLGHFLHELKNVQTAVRSNLEFVAMSEGLDEDARAALADASEALDAEQHLVRDTIESLKQRAGTPDTAFPIADVLDAVAVEAKAIRVSVAHLDAPFIVRGNPDHLHAVLTNLIRNAAEAGAARVQVETRLEAAGDAIRLIVHDDGPGIPEHRRERLFDSFGESTKSSGSGFGLFLSRRYIELFGGSIEVAEGPMGGAGFLIRLPGRAGGRLESAASPEVSASGIQKTSTAKANRSA